MNFKEAEEILNRLEGLSDAPTKSNGNLDAMAIVKRLLIKTGFWALENNGLIFKILAGMRKQPSALEKCEENPQKKSGPGYFEIVLAGAAAAGTFFLFKKYNGGDHGNQ